MEKTTIAKDYRKYLTFCPDRYGKITLFENGAVMVGLNCLDTGQSMEKHAHEVQNRFYVVLEGEGSFRINDEDFHTKQGEVIWIPAGNSHCIVNDHDAPMVLLVGIAPPHAD